jgi:predicted  nucleic acid-binding Zn-ribbon protein
MMGKAVAQQRVSELVEQVRRLRERVHDLETLLDGKDRQHSAEVRKLKEQRHMAIELLARIEREM